MIELRALAYFDAACRSESLGLAANKLGIALSTLSAALKALEQDLGTPLFRRINGGLYPTAAARSLMRSADPLLIAERFARRFVAQPAKMRLKVLTVDLALSFTIGGLCQTIRQAAETMAAERLDVLIDPVWGDEKDEPHVSDIAKDFADADHSRVVITLADPGRRARATVLLRDRWVLARRLPAGTGKPPTAADLLAGRIVVPALAPPLIEQADRYLRRNKITHVRFLTDHPGDSPRLIDEYSDAALFVPESLLSPRLGLLNVATIAVEKPPQMVVVAHVAKPNAVTALFLRHMRRALERPRSSALERPGISLRQIHYFRMVQRLRRVSAAAHAANISQPAVSEQLHKLEATLGGALFERRGDGVVPTERGERFTEFASLMESRSRQLSSLDAAAARPPSRRIAIGILPSVNQHGFLLNRVTDAIMEIRDRHPTLKLLIQEAPNAVLQDWVMRGLIGIAVVETGLPHMPRLPLGSSESLAAIAHTNHALLPVGPVTLAELVRLNLVLPTARSGLRQLLDDAAAERGLKVQPHMEIDALSMVVTMLARLPVCTVLPISALQREVAGGDLIAHPIVDPTISRRLYAIYSAERTLSQPERDLVNALRKKLGIT